jgi:hypothetical protein
MPRENNPETTQLGCSCNPTTRKQPKPGYRITSTTQSTTQGLKRVVLWARPEDVPALKAIAGQHAELVEQEVWMVAGAVEIPLWLPPVVQEISNPFGV